ncbi:ATP-grasp domain-containing protein [Roseibacillus persicicus]|uniref:ATP-grasp domain-containing protein n=1 Tax=Roseibacillus persicicus TaxID=454148 RepID=UPI0035E71A29
MNQPVGVPVYDFDFRAFFDCRTPYEFAEGIPAVARIGAIDDYSRFFAQCEADGLRLVHTPTEHTRCTTLSEWYPLIQELTPRSMWYQQPPTFAEVEANFTLPVFVKGSRQTSKHQAAASIIRSSEDFATALKIFKSDPILHWQDFVCRELLPLRPIAGGAKGKIPASYEFRTFWWRGELVGAGRYWFEAESYDWTNLERQEGLAVAKRAVDAVDCAFVVIDLAQTTEGRWVIIECNSGMESGYAGASPFAIWEAIARAETLDG